MQGHLCSPGTSSSGGEIRYTQVAVIKVRTAVRGEPCPIEIQRKITFGWGNGANIKLDLGEYAGYFGVKLESGFY